MAKYEKNTFIGSVFLDNKKVKVFLSRKIEEPVLEEQFKFTVNSGDDSSFILPLSGSSIRKTSTNYDLLIDWGDDSEPEVSQGTSSANFGISHTYPEANTNYQITIKPNGDTDGWGSAFGFAYTTSNCNTQTNRDKVISLDSPLTKSMVQKSGANDYICAGLFYKCSNVVMGDEFNLPQDLETVGNNFAHNMFYGCKLLTMGKNFNLPQSLTSVGDNFCQDMFDYYYSSGTSLLNMNEVFTMPQNLTSVGNKFCYEMFNKCKSLTMNSVFNMPQKLKSVPDEFCYNMFGGCTNMNMNDVFTMPQSLTSVGNKFCNLMLACQKMNMGKNFNLPQSLTSVGDYFCGSLFKGCFDIEMNDIFNLPQNLTTVGDSFCSSLFEGCYNSSKMNDVFTMPQNLTSVGDMFGYRMFYGNYKMNMGKNFNMPQSLTSIGNNFCYSMFDACKEILMNDVFTMPQNLTSVGDSFCAGMFRECLQLSLNNVFTMPQSLTSVGNKFCGSMFSRCSNLSLNNYITLPQNLTDIGEDYCASMFYECSSITDGIITFFGNVKYDEDKLNLTNAFDLCFSNCTGITETISPNTIPQLTIIPSSKIDCFKETTEAVQQSCSERWGGTLPVVNLVLNFVNADESNFSVISDITLNSTSIKPSDDQVINGYAITKELNQNFEISLSITSTSKTITVDGESQGMTFNKVYTMNESKILTVTIA